ncbi:MAG: hypothetical protein KGS48_00585 [Bacteroidetes bacterium]|nr:hypothetical protein [Bacteroidota bacterium]
MNKGFALFLSFLGHPLLVLFYMLVLLLACNPFMFGVRTMAEPKAVILMVSVFAITVLIPGFGVALMRPLGLIKSLHLEDRQDRTGPYIITGVFYLWLVKNLLSLGYLPDLFVKFAMGATISLFLAFFINIFLKVSAHAAGMGGLVAMLLMTQWSYPNVNLEIPALGGMFFLNFKIIVVMGILLAGLVGTARLALKAHTSLELYLGYAVGMVALVIGASVV